MRITYKISIITIILMLCIGGSYINTYATESTEVDAITETLNEITDTVIKEGLDDTEEVLDSVLDKIEEYKLEITDEQKLQLIESVLEQSGKEYDIEEIKQQLKDVEQTVSDIAKAFKIVKELFVKIADVIKQLCEAFTNWFTEFKQTEEYDELVNGVNDIKNTLESTANDLESKSAETSE